MRLRGLSDTGDTMPTKPIKSNTRELKTPDVTPLQIAAAVISGVPSILILASVHLTHAQAGAVTDLQHLALGVLGADAVVRVGRAIGNARKV